MKRIVIGLFFLIVSASASAQTFQTTVLNVSPVCDTAVYASGELVGGKLTITDSSHSLISGVISNVIMGDKAAQGLDIDLVIFNEDPTGTTFTDQAAFDPADADQGKIACVVQIRTFSAHSDNGMGFANNVNCPFVTTTGTLYGAVVARGAVDYASSSDLTFRLGILRDY
jgi:hypothetical protein